MAMSLHRQRDTRVPWLLLVAACSAAATGACGRIGYEFVPGATGNGPGGPTGAGGLVGGAGAGDSGRDASASDAAGSGGAWKDAGDGGSTAGAGGAGDAASDSGGPGVEGGLGDSGSGAQDAGPPPCILSPQDLPDWCQQIPELAAPPVIDGALECPLALRPITPLGWTAGGSADVTVEYAIAWAASGLYFFVRVHDPAVVPAAPTEFVWEGDAVELFVDNDGAYTQAPAFDAEGTRQLIVAAPDPAASGPSTRGVIYLQGGGASVPWTSSTFASFLEPDGYAVEALVVAADLGLATWSLAAQARVGFDVGVDVSFPTAAQTGPEGHRMGQFFLSLAPAAPLEPYQNVGAFCDPTLVAR